MDYAITLKLGLLLFLLICSGFFSGSEASLFSLSSLHIHKMKEDRLPFVTVVQNLLARPRKLLVTILVGNESINIAITALTTALFIYLLGEKGKWVAIAITTIVVIIFGEAIPKTFAVTYPRRFSCAVALPLRLVSVIAWPAVWTLEKISAFFVWGFSGRGEVTDKGVMEEEFRTLVDVGHQEGALEETQKDLIHRVFELAETTVADVMTPRVDMFCLPLSMSFEEMEQNIISKRHSRIPVYGTDKDDILGIVYTKYFLSALRSGKKSDIRTLMKKPYFVPEERPAHSMLRDFRIRKIQMAIVVDEYGGVAGLVTLTDILNSLFGKIYQELDLQKYLFRKIDDNTYVVTGMMEIEDFNERVGASIATEDFDTIGGFVLHLFGELPAPGDTISFEGITFTAETISKKRISTLSISKGEEVRKGV